MKTKTSKAKSPRGTEIVWMPHAAHFICGDQCRFRLATYVNGVIVSTVGEYYPSYSSYQDKPTAIGAGRTYETMVFPARRSTNKCCPWQQASGSEIESLGYNDADAARAGHDALVRKWSRARRS